MQDRFKFRLWHKPLKIMHYNDFTVTATEYMAKIYQQDDYMMKFNQEDLEFDKQCILMQCTGLKDKNGKLIYEGDIVKEYYYNTKETAIKKTIFDENICGYAYTDGIEYNSLCFSDCRRLEVIGNIYENKDLLNESISNS